MWIHLLSKVKVGVLYSPYPFLSFSHFISLLLRVALGQEVCIRICLSSLILCHMPDGNLGHMPSPVESSHFEADVKIYSIERSKETPQWKFIVGVGSELHIRRQILNDMIFLKTCQH